MPMHTSTYQTETRRVIGVLQQWQFLLAELCDTSATEVTLAEVQAVTAGLQETFGASATLETIIQTLVGQDLREQLDQRQPERADLAWVA